MLVNLNKYTSYFISIMLLSSCGFMPISSSHEINIKIDEGIPMHFAEKLQRTFNNNERSGLEIFIKNYDLKKYEVYGGNALRSLEAEIKLTISININHRGAHKRNKQIMSMKRYKTNELNPFAQDEMVKLLIREMEDDLIQQFILEVNLIDM